MPAINYCFSNLILYLILGIIYFIFGWNVDGSNMNKIRKINSLINLVTGAMGIWSIVILNDERF